MAGWALYGATILCGVAYRNNRVNDYADIINQFVTVARHNYDPKTDLYRHACDVSKREKVGG